MSDFLQRSLRSAAGLLLSICAATAGISAGAAHAAAGVQRDPVAAEAARAGMQALITASRAARATSKPNDVVVNPYRAYPPSCLSDGLPFGNFRPNQSDPAPFQQSFVLPGDPLNNADSSYSETVTITVWRVPCSKDSSGNGQSATLLEIDRPCGVCNNTSQYPTFPIVVVTQGNNSLYVRLATDQNTWYSTTYVNDPIYYSNIWVLENYYADSVQLDFNQAFSIAFDNSFQFNVPAYNAAQYVATSQSLPISGYMTSNWYQPGQGGEGMLTQIFDNPGSDPPTRTFTAAWYTFGTDGLPFWLFAQGVFNVGATTTGPVDTYYPTGGSFAGTGSKGTFTKWGTITFSFPDCDHMAFTFNGTSSANASVGPSGNGQRTWLRIANVNSIVCD